MATRRLIVALCVAILISGLFTYFLSRRMAHDRSSHAQLRYVFAGKALNAGQLLTATDLKVDQWSGGALDGAFTRPQDIVGRTLLYPIAAGQPLLDRQLSAAGGSTGLSTRITEGMRAISLKSDQVVGVAGYLFPGTHVDVLVSLNTNTNQNPITSTVLQDVQILTAGQKMQPDPDGKASQVDVVTLLVTPEGAEKVALASAQGRIHFVLRNSADHSITDNPATELASLTKEAPKTPAAAPAPVVVRRAPVAAPPPPPRAPYQVEIIQGDKQSVEKF